MLDRAATYKSSQILTASPVERVVLLYRGAIRFATAAIAGIEAGTREPAHVASLRAQEIVSALRETLDLSAGPVAAQLDALYDFCLRRLVEGNLRQDARPVREAIAVLAGLLEAWSQLAAGQAAGQPAAGQPAGAPLAAGALPSRATAGLATAAHREPPATALRTATAYAAGVR